MRVSMMRILLLALILFGVAPVAANGLDHYFEQGNRAYSDGNYKQAIENYNAILAAGRESAAVYYNLGNACFRDGQLGLAIANYIRARKLDPRDDDIRTNLDFARQFAIDKIEVTEETILLDYVNNFFSSFSLREITFLAAILYVLSALLVLARYVYRWISLSTPVVVVVLSLFVISAHLVAFKLNQEVITRTGVVTALQVQVKNGPGADFNDQFTAHAGLTFTIERREDGYYLVNFENRLKGWIEARSIVEI